MLYRDTIICKDGQEIVVTSKFLGYFLGWFLSVVFMLAYLVAIVRMVMVWMEPNKDGMSPRKLVHFILPFGVLARASHLTYQALDICLVVQPSSSQSPIIALIASLPGYIILLSFLFLLLVWMATYHKGSTYIPYVKKLGIVLGFIILLIWAVLMILFFKFSRTPTTLKTLHIIEASYSALLFAIMGICYCIYGTNIFLKLRLLGSVNQAVQKFKRVLGWVTILSTILFLGRAVTTLSDWFLKDQSVDFVIGEKVFFSNPV